MKALVGAFNQEKALVGAFSVIVKTDCETDGSSAALILTFPLQIHMKYDSHPTAVHPDWVQAATRENCNNDRRWFEVWIKLSATRPGHTMWLHSVYVYTANCNFIQCRIIARQWYILSGYSIGYMHMNMRLFRNVSLTSFVAWISWLQNKWSSILTECLYARFTPVKSTTLGVTPPWRWVI